MEIAQTPSQSKCKFQVNLIPKPTCLPQTILKVMKSNFTFPHDFPIRNTVQPGLSIYLVSKLIAGLVEVTRLRCVMSFWCYHPCAREGAKKLAFLNTILQERLTLSIESYAVCEYMLHLQDGYVTTKSQSPHSSPS